MKSSPKESPIINRRNFFALSVAGLSGLFLRPGQEKTENQTPEQKTLPPGIDTNIDQIRVIPRKQESLPGKWPGRVVKIQTPGASNEGTLNPTRIKGAVEKGLQVLSGKRDISQAWREFVGTDDVVGIKVNPIGGRLLSTKPEIVQVIIDGLLQAGLQKKTSSFGTADVFNSMRRDSLQKVFPASAFWGPK